jgi:hypothetical protein
MAEDPVRTTGVSRLPLTDTRERLDGSRVALDHDLIVC